MAQIRIEHLRKAFDQFTAVQGSNFTIEDGSFFALLGPSGCGKTTTLRMIAGLELPTEGRILLDGEDVTFHRASARDIAFVFQLFALYPHMNVAQNIGFPLKCAGMSRREIRERVAETARLLRIEHLLSSKTSKLSGGDRQRVALGRAMVRRPKAFLMDEPLGALDAEFRHLMCTELRDLHERINATTVYVTHDQLEAMSMADTIAVMNGGRIEQAGSAEELYEAPRTKFVANFLGTSNLIDAKLGAAASDTVAVRTHDGADLHVPADRVGPHHGDQVAIGVRPEKIAISRAGAGQGARGNVLRGKVEVSSFLGIVVQYVVRSAGGEELTVICQNDDGTGQAEFAAGQDVELSWDPRHTFVVGRD
jgi:multiple sugar transport system ATP-binding protein